MLRQIAMQITQKPKDLFDLDTQFLHCASTVWQKGTMARFYFCARYNHRPQTVQMPAKLTLHIHKLMVNTADPSASIPPAA